MSSKSDNKNWEPDEIEFDLDKLSEYMRNLQPGQYTNVEEMVEKCASQEIDLEKLSKYVSMIKPGEYLIFDNLVIECSGDGYEIHEMSDEGEEEA